MKAPTSVLIVGGGTAGWMTACLLAKHWSPTQISLIESSDIGTIGVGEGSTPYLKSFFQQLNIPESEWMPACDATYKVGINFANWIDENNNTSQTTSNSYFHPFFTPFDLQSGNDFFQAADQRRKGAPANTRPEDYFVAAELVRQGVAPVSPKLTENIDYAYHFDAGKLGELLKNYARNKGVQHIVDNVIEVKSDRANSQSQQQIQGVISAQHGELTADLYIDCSGFRGILAKQALKREFHSYRKTLFNDAAVAIATPSYSIPEQEPAPEQEPEQSLTPPKTTDLSRILQTESNALSAGWMWRIPLTRRMGNGYVYSSQFLSKDQAEQELRQALHIKNPKNTQNSDDIPARHLTMQVGRLNQHWQSNCIAIGLAQGFIEPLEATALMLVQYAIQQLVDNWETQNKPAYNHEMNRMFDGIRDYIAAHYFLNKKVSHQRTHQHEQAKPGNNDYWQACRYDMQVPPVLKELVDAWEQNRNFTHALKEVEQQLVYLKPSWYCILAGMERFPGIARNMSLTHNGQSKYLKDVVEWYFLPKQ